MEWWRGVGENVVVNVESNLFCFGLGFITMCGDAWEGGGGFNFQTEDSGAEANPALKSYFYNAQLN